MTRLSHLAHICWCSFFDARPTTQISPLSLHDALPITSSSNIRSLRSEFIGSMRAWLPSRRSTAHQRGARVMRREGQVRSGRSEEHTSELQSRFDLVCLLLLEKKKMTPDYLIMVAGMY